MACLVARCPCHSGASVNRRVGDWVVLLRRSSLLNSRWGVGIGRVMRGGSSTALGVLLSLRMLTVRTGAFRSSPMFRFGFWVLSSRNLYLGYDRFPTCSTSAFSSLDSCERKFSGELITDSSFRSDYQSSYFFLPRTTSG